MWLELFWSKFNWTVYFLWAVFRFRFIACIQIQSFTGCFIFLHLSTLPRPDFPGKKLRTFLFLFCFYASFHGACKPCNDSYVLKLDWIIMKGQAQKHVETKLTNITRRHFCSLPNFFIERSFNTLFTFSYRKFVSIFCLFWHTLTAHDDTWQEHN